MSSTSVIENPILDNPAHASAAPAAAPAPPSGPLAGAPGIVGIPMAVAGAFGLGLVNTGFIPASAAAAALPTVIAASAVGLLLTTVWACALGQNTSAGIFVLFFGFFATYGALSLGLINGWYGIPADQMVNAQALWLTCWLFIFVMLTFVTLRLPLELHPHARFRRHRPRPAPHGHPAGQYGHDQPRRLVYVRVRCSGRLPLRRRHVEPNRWTRAAPRAPARPLSSSVSVHETSQRSRPPVTRPLWAGRGSSC